MIHTNYSQNFLTNYPSNFPDITFDYLIPSPCASSAPSFFDIDRPVQQPHMKRSSLTFGTAQLTSFIEERNALIDAAAAKNVLQQDGDSSQESTCFSSPFNSVPTTRPGSASERRRDPLGDVLRRAIALEFASREEAARRATQSVTFLEETVVPKRKTEKRKASVAAKVLLTRQDARVSSVTYSGLFFPNIIEYIKNDLLGIELDRLHHPYYDLPLYYFIFYKSAFTSELA